MHTGPIATEKRMCEGKNKLFNNLLSYFGKICKRIACSANRINFAIGIVIRKAALIEAAR